VNPVSDVHLWRLVKDGDTKAFSELYEKYWLLLYNAVYWRVCSEDAAKDIIQNVFISLWEKRSAIDIRENVEGYLKVAAKHSVLNYFKAEETRAKHYKHAVAAFTEGVNIIEETIRDKELNNIYREEIARLPEKMREIFVLSRQQGLTAEQIAVQLDLSPQTVKNQLTSALKKMRIRFGPYLGIVGTTPIVFLLLQK
jgi:RNA polymerase sigma-70 factor (family 1)